MCCVLVLVGYRLRQAGRLALSKPEALEALEGLEGLEKTKGRCAKKHTKGA